MSPRMSTHEGGGGWPCGTGGLPPGSLGRPSGNYFGDGSDGNMTIAADTSLPSTLDGDMVVKHYKNLTVNASMTLTVANRCRGLLLYVDGDLTVNGSIAMSARGCAANPLDAVATANTPVAPSDGHGVPAGGLVLRRRKAGSTDVHTDATLLHGCGAAAVAAEARQGRVLGNGKVWTLPVAGGAGGPGTGGKTGGTRALAPGGGGSGSSYYSGVPGRGGNGTCFSGGVGSGGGGAAPQGNDYGGPGSNGTSNGGGTGACGGVGNPAGSPFSGAPAQNSGTGGLLVIIVRGNVVLAAGSAVVAHGVGGVAGGIPGGCSGGGNILILHGGTYTNAGTVAANGGAGGDGSAWGITVGYGGAGSVSVDSIDNI